eukprot:TRINITY_DN3851_c0_g2_i1.p2 TRINITY_DN3851_c0_g2~~TRINITY_DN3851_c0_g2_i1.p2  ORF type:complete len:107 (+),score=12.79 TRINITY_DN3851_c0_g2_i1:60-380(+)
MVEPELLRAALERLLDMEALSEDFESDVHFPQAPVHFEDSDDEDEGEDQTMHDAWENDEVEDEVESVNQAPYEIMYRWRVCYTGHHESPAFEPARSHHLFARQPQS